MDPFTRPAHVEVDPGWSITTLLAHRVAKDPGRTLVEIEEPGGWRALSGAQFTAEVTAVAKGLMAAGIRAGDLGGELRAAQCPPAARLLDLHQCAPGVLRHAVREQRGDAPAGVDLDVRRAGEGIHAGSDARGARRAASGPVPDDDSGNVVRETQERPLLTPVCHRAAHRRGAGCG